MNASNELRVSLSKMRNRNKSYTNTKKSDLNMRDMLKITRNKNLFEEEEKAEVENKEAYGDQAWMEEKFNKEFFNTNVSVDFEDLEVFDDYVMWGGTINNIIQFIFLVTPDESTSGVKFNYMEDFSPENPENEEIIKKVEAFYNTFYREWRDNVLK